MKNLFVIIIALLCSLGLFSQNEVPSHFSNNQVIKHQNYTLSYDEYHEQAAWVAYELTADEVRGTHERTEDFREDPMVKTESAQLFDYKGSGYDRGHLAPAGDMKFSVTAMSESFYMSNMSPQEPGFNRGIWKQLEEQVRQWALSEGTIYVVTGPIFEGNKEKIGPNEVTVPGFYYKVILAPNSEKAIGFVLPHRKSDKDVSSFAVSVDHVEDLTQINFFNYLDNEIEDYIESSFSYSDWNLAIPSSSKNNVGDASSAPTNTSKVSSSSVKSSSSSSAQCLGTAKSTGVRCKNNTTNTNGYCYAHQKQAPGYVAPPKSNYTGRCNATTKSGTRCKRNAESGRRYCWQH
jgi:endonuclease G